MGRGRVQLKRIENKINRQVTFSKRRGGIIKKAHEISVLCDADVGLIIFSHRGKLFEFSSDSCMEKVLERYERYSYAERQLSSNDPETQVNWTFDFAKLKAKLELLQRNHRHYLGQDLDSLNMKDIQNLEQQLDTALKHIRTRMNQLMNESISQLQKKNTSAPFLQFPWEKVMYERAMQDQNNTLAKKIKERGKINAPSSQAMQWQQQQNHHQQGLPEASNYEAFHAPLPSLNMSNSYEGEYGGQGRRNDLDLTLQPIYSCHMGCFTDT